MFELDLRNAKLLKKFLSVRYSNYEINKISNICDLTRKCFMAFLGWIAVFIGVVFITVISSFGVFIISAPFTLFLPEGFQAPLDFMQMGFVFNVVVLIIAIVMCTVETLKGNMRFAPEYITKYIIKEEHIPKKEKEPSQTWIAIKEMCKSIKDKTCIKVKM